jgi:hypothetical protein
LILVALMTMAFLAVAAGAVMAAPHASEQATGGLTAILTDTITPTLTFTHPVALAISDFFGIPYTEVMSLHQSGLGFGEIARVYMIAKYSNGQVTPDQVLQMRESGEGWGQIMKQLGFHPGGKGLGAIMSGHGVKDQPNGKPDDKDNSNRPDCPGKSCNAPGHKKP